MSRSVVQNSKVPKYKICACFIPKLHKRNKTTKAFGAKTGQIKVWFDFTFQRDDPGDFRLFKILYNIIPPINHTDLLLPPDCIWC